MGVVVDDADSRAIFLMVTYGALPYMKGMRYEGPIRHREVVALDTFYI